jgi:(p)ppGpp synthase/HD superfamily hydrolase
MNNLEKAKQFCIEKHKNQKRKYTDEPYHVHPVEVMEIVKTINHTEEMLIAALLHDTVEDTETTFDEIEQLFGKEVMELVECLTDVSKPADGNREKRKEMDRLHTQKASQNAKTIKLADLISNTRSIVEHDQDFAKIYMKEKNKLLEVLKEGDPTLYKKAQDLLMEYFLTRKK